MGSEMCIRDSHLAPAPWQRHLKTAPVLGERECRELLLWVRLGGKGHSQVLACCPQQPLVADHQTSGQAACQGVSPRCLFSPHFTSALCPTPHAQLILVETKDLKGLKHFISVIGRLQAATTAMRHCWIVLEVPERLAHQEVREDLEDGITPASILVLYNGEHLPQVGRYYAYHSYEAATRLLLLCAAQC